MGKESVIIHLAIIASVVLAIVVTLGMLSGFQVCHEYDKLSKKGYKNARINDSR
jgi:hypothetical protein